MTDSEDKNTMIIIKTMTNLPEHCYDCPCHDGESGYCQADKEHRYSEYRPFWCPLVKISRKNRTAKWVLYRDYKNAIDYPQCNKCGVVICIDFPVENLNYCPNCGAYMGGEE